MITVDIVFLVLLCALALCFAGMGAIIIGAAVRRFVARVKSLVVK